MAFRFTWASDYQNSQKWLQAFQISNTIGYQYWWKSIHVWINFVIMFEDSDVNYFFSVLDYGKRQDEPMTNRTCSEFSGISMIPWNQVRCIVLGSGNQIYLTAAAVPLHYCILFQWHVEEILWTCMMVWKKGFKPYTEAWAQSEASDFAFLLTTREKQGKKKKKSFNFRSFSICSTLALRGHGIFRSKAICRYVAGPAPTAAAQFNKWFPQAPLTPSAWSKVNECSAQTFKSTVGSGGCLKAASHWY